MNTNTYGDAYFRHKTNFGSIVVFSDEEKMLVPQDELYGSTNQYISIYQNEETGQWIAKTRDRLSGEYGDFMINSYNLSPEGNIQADQLTFFLTLDQEVQYGDLDMDYYRIDGKLHLQVNATIELQEVVITASGASNGSTQEIEDTIAPEERIIPTERSDAFITVFVSSDGAKLERAYQQINNVKGSELVIFAEKDDSTNLFGSVFRVLSGNRIDSTSIYPKLELANIMRAYTSDPSLNMAALSDLISKYYEDLNNENIFLWLPRLGASFIKVVAGFTLQPIGEIMYDIADEIDKGLRLNENSWKATIDGELNTKYDPILPGYGLLTNESNVEKWTNKINNKFIDPMAKPIKKLIRKLKNNKLTKHFIGNRLDGLLRFIEEIPNYLEGVISSIFEFLKNAFEFFNALLVGIINSIVDLLKSVFEILGLICKGLYSLTELAEDVANKTNSYLGLVLESFENLISLVASVFTLENLKAFINFQLFIIKTVGKLGVIAIQKAIQFFTEEGSKAEPEIPEEESSLPYDAIGYYTGYIIGFVAQEVAIFMATAGVGTLAKGIQGAVKSYVELGKAIGRTVKATANKAQRFVSFSIESFLKAIEALKGFAKQIPKHLKSLMAWMDELLASLTKAANQLFKGFEAVLDLLLDLGVIIVQKLDPNTEKVIVQGVDGAIYAIKQGDKTVFEGTKSAIEGFLNKIEDISKKGGNSSKNTQKYLDEVAEGSIYSRLLGNSPIYGFKSFEELKQFGVQIYNTFTVKGYKNVKVYMQGSSVTGKSYETGKIFDTGRKSDFDVGIVSKELLEKALDLGLAKSNRGYSIPLKLEEMKKLGFEKLIISLQKKYAREVNFRVYNTVAEMNNKVRKSYTIKF
ncbi:hypothetical protein [Psychroserpens luteus]|uniref:Uncharacterized protein n=1 Tax=Psychroserpens luteus TaxID=1434066 RepID=A0ABW5ZVM1_9FLAO|nr:hypothetical protein [Psychroserpens luteus]